MGELRTGEAGMKVDDRLDRWDRGGLELELVEVD